MSIFEFGVLALLFMIAGLLYYIGNCMYRVMPRYNDINNNHEKLKEMLESRLNRINQILSDINSNTYKGYDR